MRSLDFDCVVSAPVGVALFVIRVHRTFCRLCGVKNFVQYAWNQSLSLDKLAPLVLHVGVIFMVFRVMLC